MASSKSEASFHTLHPVTRRCTKHRYNPATRLCEPDWRERLENSIDYVADCAYEDCRPYFWLLLLFILPFLVLGIAVGAAKLYQRFSDSFYLKEFAREQTDIHDLLPQLEVDPHLFDKEVRRLYGKWNYCRPEPVVDEFGEPVLTPFGKPAIVLMPLSRDPDSATMG